MFHLFFIYFFLNKKLNAFWVTNDKAPRSKTTNMQFAQMEFFDQYFTPVVRPMVIDNQIMVYNMEQFGTIIGNMWYYMGKITGYLFDIFLSKSLDLGQFIYDLSLPMDLIAFIFVILLIFVAFDNQSQRENIQNKNMEIEIGDMRAKIEFYEAKHQSYDILVSQLYNNVNKMRRTIQKLEREMKKYD